MVKKVLQAKLKNCLETILEFENTLLFYSKSSVTNFSEEINFLKNSLKKLEEIEFDDKDLERIEKITLKFLAEIKELVRQKIIIKTAVQ
ncbi:MAG: hypothetical protein Q9M37_04900 [Desulfonauticus sp.]|nr:hypothetical protein [Desulfonauticus sp.]